MPDHAEPKNALMDIIKAKAQSLKPLLTEMRRHLHMNPELSFQEYNTAAWVEDYLQNKLGLKTQRLANTGVVALIEGKQKDSNKVVGLRADMDALPITEVNDGRPYRSQNEGVMHACGHDVHTTSLLGAATILNELSHNFSGTIKLVFQPGEEKLPGGASLMIADGVLQNPKPDVMIGQHVMPQIPTGRTGFRPGLYMASTDEIYMTVHGKGGHGAMPHFNIDPVLIAAHIITGLQQVVSRNANPAVPSVLSFGKVIANGATNVIPPEVKLEGTFRTLNEQWRATAHEKITQMATGIAQSMGGSVDIEIRRGYPFLHNDEELTLRCKNAASEYLGEPYVENLDIWMAAEDFAYYSQEVPSCFYRLGVRNEEKGIVNSVHHPAFDADEDALEDGAGLLAWLAIQELNK
jgi:amidohydrolase